MERKLPVRIAAIGVGHWHSLFDAAYLKTLARMPEVQLVGVQDPDAALAAQRAGQVGDPPTFTDYRRKASRRLSEDRALTGRALVSRLSTMRYEVTGSCTS